MARMLLEGRLSYNARPMEHSRRSFAVLLGAMGSAPLWDLAVAEAKTQGTVTVDTVGALLDAQGGRSIFSDPARFDELRSAVTRSAVTVAALRAFPVPADVPPAVMFGRR
jgi:hypothetical protein